MKFSQYLGIFLGAVYGLIIRLIGGEEAFSGLYSIYSITFIWITPIIIGLIPILISSNELYKSRRKLFLYPVLAVLTFGILSLSTGIEDLLCVLILEIPFMLMAGFVGLGIGTVIKNRKIDKKLYSVIFLPLLLNPIESMLPNSTAHYTVENKIVISKSAKVVWPNILEVPLISDDEYDFGFYNYIGVPRPIKSVVDRSSSPATRTGYFSDGLVLYETIAKEEEGKFVSFKIDLDKSQLRSKPTDQHLLKSGYFSFESISYQLISIDESTTQLILKCEYRIDSKMNGYADFWASRIIADFELRLLNALKNKLEKN